MEWRIYESLLESGMFFSRAHHHAFALSIFFGWFKMHASYTLSFLLYCRKYCTVGCDTLVSMITTF